MSRRAARSTYWSGSAISGHIMPKFRPHPDWTRPSGEGRRRRSVPTLRAPGPVRPGPYTTTRRGIGSPPLARWLRRRRLCYLHDEGRPFERPSGSRSAGLQGAFTSSALVGRDGGSGVRSPKPAANTTAQAPSPEPVIIANPRGQALVASGGYARDFKIPPADGTRPGRRAGARSRLSPARKQPHVDEVPVSVAGLARMPGQPLLPHRGHTRRRSAECSTERQSSGAGPSTSWRCQMASAGSCSRNDS
jgi:hypothetical protein